MPDMTPQAARNYGFCYLGLLRCADRLNQILKILPEARQREIGVYLQRAQSLNLADLTSRLHILRQQAHRPKGPANVPWETLSPALQRCLSVCAQENYGRQDH
jgi:hypothetical protein